LLDLLEVDEFNFESKLMMFYLKDNFIPRLALIKSHDYICRDQKEAFLSKTTKTLLTATIRNLRNIFVAQEFTSFW